jgi:signal transduction histidine kinase
MQLQKLSILIADDHEVIGALCDRCCYPVQNGRSAAKPAIKRNGGMAQLTVEDTGVDIPKSELHKIFERFHRVEGTSGRTHEGTGIGLALVQELVKLHGGSISVESEDGFGMRFIVLPFCSAHLLQDRIGHSTDERARARHRAMFQK